MTEKGTAQLLLNKNHLTVKAWHIQKTVTLNLRSESQSISHYLEFGPKIVMVLQNIF